MKNAELAKRIFDCLSDGYDDEECREDAELSLRNELAQLGNDSCIKTVLRLLSEEIEELMSSL